MTRKTFREFADRADPLRLVFSFRFCKNSQFAEPLAKLSVSGYPDIGRLVELADTPDLGSGAERCRGSSPRAATSVFSCFLALAASV